MNNELSIIATKNFNGVEFNCYKTDGQDNGDFWATREQIGQLLEYVNPLHAIKDIHTRHADRLDKFSTWRNLSQVEGSRTVTRKVIVYNFRGLLEICRWSNQPKANDVMDFLWDVAEDIRKHGMYLSEGMMEQLINNPVAFEQVAAGYINSKYAPSDKTALMVLGYSVHLGRTLFIVKEAANILRQFGLDTGEYKLWRMLREDGFACRHDDRRHNVPTQKGLDEKILAMAFTGKTPLTMMTVDGVRYYAQKLVQRDFPLLAG